MMAIHGPARGFRILRIVVPLHWTVVAVAAIQEGSREYGIAHRKKQKEAQQTRKPLASPTQIAGGGMHRQAILSHIISLRFKNLPRLQSCAPASKTGEMGCPWVCTVLEYFRD